MSKNKSSHYEILGSLKDYVNILSIGKRLKRLDGKPMSGDVMNRCERRQVRTTKQIYVYPRHVLGQLVDIFTWLSGECLKAAKRYRKAFENYELYRDEGFESLEKEGEKKDL